MKTKLNRFQTTKGSAITFISAMSLSVIIAMIAIIYAINSNDISKHPYIGMGGLAILVIIITAIYTFAAKLSTISNEQEQWFLENAARKIIKEETFTLNDFYPNHQYEDINPNEFKVMPERNLQFELERKTDGIVFRTSKPEFSAVLSTTDIADNDIRQNISKKTKHTTLVYNLPATTETFSEWTKRDEKFYIDLFLKSINKF